MPNPKSDSDVNVDGASRSLSGLSMVEPDAHSVMKDFVWPCSICYRDCLTRGALESHTRLCHSPRKKKHHGSTSTKSHKGGKKRAFKLRAGFKALLRSPIPEAASDSQTPDPKEELSNPISETTVKHERDDGASRSLFRLSIPDRPSDSQRSTPKEEFSNPRSEMVEPDSTSQQGTEMPFHCEICADDFDWETLRSLETHKLCDHDVRREDLVTFRDEPPKHKIELDAVETDLVCEPPTNKSSVLNGLRNMIVDDLGQTQNPKEEFLNPRSTMFEPDVPESPMKKTYLCHFCSRFIESRSDYEEHIVSKHREESGMQKPSPCFFCNRVFESTRLWDHMKTDHQKEIWDDQLARRMRDIKNASQLYKAADQCVSESLPSELPKQETESDVVDADLETDHYSKPPLLNGLRHLTVDDLEKLELSDLAYIRFSSVPMSTNDCDIVPMEEIIALQATSVSYGSVIKTGQYADCPHAREVIRCLTCGSRVIQDRALRDICLRGCPPGWACRSEIVGPYRPSEVSERYYKILSSG